MGACLRRHAGADFLVCHGFLLGTAPMDDCGRTGTARRVLLRLPILARIFWRLPAALGVDRSSRRADGNSARRADGVPFADCSLAWTCGHSVVAGRPRLEP